MEHSRFPWLWVFVQSLKFASGWGRVYGSIQVLKMLCQIKLKAYFPPKELSGIRWLNELHLLLVCSCILISELFNLAPVMTLLFINRLISVFHWHPCVLSSLIGSLRLYITNNCSVYGNISPTSNFIKKNFLWIKDHLGKMLTLWFCKSIIWNQ